MRLEDFDKGEMFQANVLQNTLISSPDATDEVRELLLEVKQNTFEYHVGQSVGVLVPGITEIGHPHHFRLYTVADTHKVGENGFPLVKLCVKRCSYIDQYSGERYQGVASNYLCDRDRGDPLTINGPFGTPFPVPKDKSSDLLLIGMGTGIAPFRAFIRHIYQDVGDWRGQIRLFYGARTGLELVYMNQQIDDFSQYYDEQTFEAIKALSPRALWDKNGHTDSLDQAIQERAEDILYTLTKSNGYTYIAGLKELKTALDKTFARLLKSEQAWETLKAKLHEQGRWVELLY